MHLKMVSVILMAVMVASCSGGISSVTPAVAQLGPTDVWVSVSTVGSETTEMMEILRYPLPIVMGDGVVILQDGPLGGALYTPVAHGQLQTDHLESIDELIDVLGMGDIEDERLVYDFGDPDGPTTTISIFDAAGRHRIAAYDLMTAVDPDVPRLEVLASLVRLLTPAEIETSEFLPESIDVYTGQIPEVPRYPVDLIVEPWPLGEVFDELPVVESRWRCQTYVGEAATAIRDRFAALPSETVFLDGDSVFLMAAQPALPGVEPCTALSPDRVWFRQAPTP